MLTLPDAIVALLVPFATLFTSPTWRKAQVLLVGAILTPGQRTVAAALRVMGRSDQRDYARYHEVLNRAVWSSRQAARILLVLLLQHLDGGDGPLIFGIDETLERRRGAKIRARAIYRDPVPAGSKASGLRSVAGPRQLGLAGAHGAGAFDVTTNSRDASTRSSGPARWSCNCAPHDPWCWWATTAMPCCMSLLPVPPWGHVTLWRGPDCGTPPLAPGHPVNLARPPP